MPISRTDNTDQAIASWHRHELKPSAEMRKEENVRDSMVFVVDDDPVYRGVVRNLMESVELPVKSFASAREFLAYYVPTQPGCLILDIRMPGMSGLELLRILTANRNHLPIIMITAFADVATAIEAMKCGAMDFIEKPHLPQQLLENVQHALVLDEDRCHRDALGLTTRRLLKTLTPREHEILDLLMEGKTAKQIARKLQITTRTVDFHRRNVLNKMEVDNTVQLTRMIDEYEFRQSRPNRPR